jgi:hypothetical protein
MNKKRKLHITKYILFWLLGWAFLWAGMLYTRFEKWGISATIPTMLRSQAVSSENTLPPEKIKARITQLEEEILQETNDPERALELRRQVQKLRELLPRE